MCFIYNIFSVNYITRRILVLQMSASSTKLIENPKTRKDWEHNQQYYRSKYFSKKELDKVEKDKKTIAHCVKIMTIRSHGDGGCNALNGGYCPVIKKKKIFAPVNIAEVSQQEIPKQAGDRIIDEVKTRILTITETLRDEWEAETEELIS